MGYIAIKVGGSFVGHYGIRSVDERFDAIHNGHADAVARAIEYLSGVVLPRAVALDHDLHEKGSKPRLGFTPERIIDDTVARTSAAVGAVMETRRQSRGSSEDR